MLLQELFKKSGIETTVSLRAGVMWQAVATLPNGDDFKFKAEYINADLADGCWEVEFGINGKYAISNNKTQSEVLTVFSLVLETIKSFVKECNPEIVTFSGDEGHVQFYKRLFKRGFDDWEKMVLTNNRDQIFIAVKDGAVPGFTTENYGDYLSFNPVAVYYGWTINVYDSGEVKVHSPMSVNNTCKTIIEYKQKFPESFDKLLSHMSEFNGGKKIKFSESHSATLMKKIFGDLVE